MFRTICEILFGSSTLECKLNLINKSSLFNEIRITEELFDTIRKDLIRQKTRTNLYSFEDEMIELDNIEIKIKKAMVHYNQHDQLQARICLIRISLDLNKFLIRYIRSLSKGK